MSWTEEQLAEHYAKLKQPQPGAETPAPPTERSEFSVQEECVKFMQEDGWRALRTDPVSDRTKGKGFGELGMPDYLFMRPDLLQQGRYSVVWVEFKSRLGKLMKHQLEWHNKERARGFTTWIAGQDFGPTVDGFRAHYSTSGLMRRARWW